MTDKSAAAAEGDKELLADGENAGGEGGDDTAAAEAAAVEERARRLGWVPKEEFKGDQKRHMSAQEYIDRGEQLLPIMIQRNRTLDDQLGQATKDLRDTKSKLDEALAGFSELREFASKAEERAYKRARKELEEKRDAAVAAADVPAHAQAIKEIEELDASVTPAPATKPKAEEPGAKPAAEKTDGAPQLSKAVTDFVAANPWFNRDRVLNAAAIDTLDAVNAETPDMPEADKYAEVARRVKAEFPERFGNPRRAAPAAVRTPSPPADSKKKGRTFDDLPKDAKAAWERFNKLDPKFTKEDYVKHYDWED